MSSAPPPDPWRSQRPRRKTWPTNLTRATTTRGRCRYPHRRRTTTGILAATVTTRPRGNCRRRSRGSPVVTARGRAISTHRWSSTRGRCVGTANHLSSEASSRWRLWSSAAWSSGCCGRRPILPIRRAPTRRRPHWFRLRRMSPTPPSKAGYCAGFLLAIRPAPASRSLRRKTLWHSSIARRTPTPVVRSRQPIHWSGTKPRSAGLSTLSSSTLSSMPPTS